MKILLLAMLRLMVHLGCFILFLPIWAVIGLQKRIQGQVDRPPCLVWGPLGLISYKYWSGALKKVGYNSTTFVDGYYQPLFKKTDFDRYTGDLLPFPEGSWLRTVGRFCVPYLAFTDASLRYDIFHHAFFGGFLGNTPLWRTEAYLLKWVRCKTVFSPVGGDAYLLSMTLDLSLRHGLLLTVPQLARQETQVAAKVKYWQRHADIVIMAFMVDGIGRWDVLPYNMVALDCTLWTAKVEYSDSNGSNQAVKVLHAPNHRGFKGTEFVVRAVEELKSEGFKIELLLIENVQNDEIRRLMREEADILVEQLIFGYALTAIEGMASGLPVLSNLDNETYTRLFRRYSYLDECPILSATPESIKQNLKVLVTNPRLRRELGVAGRRYVEKYHSEETAQYMFGAIYDRIWYDKDVDLLNLFHPLKSAYNQQLPRIAHPLVENHLPATLRSAA